MSLREVSSNVLALFFILAMLPSLALTQAALDLNDISVDDTGQYLIEGPDPYLTFSPVNHEEAVEGAKYLIVNIKLDATSTSQQNVPMELFFKSKSNTKPVFDPLYRLQFSVPTTSLVDDSVAFALALPSDRNFAAKDIMRLDIDACLACRFKVISHPKLSATLANNIEIVEPSRIFNGLTTVPLAGRSLELTGWTLNDLSQVGTQIQLSGGDPFMISPSLNSATEELAGLHVELEPGDTKQDSHQFQLFYATEYHGFSERAATSVSVSANDSGLVAFFIPLHFLAVEHPRNILLERLRLDFPQDQLGSHWTLNSIRLIHKNQLPQFAELTPKRRLEAKPQRATGLTLLGNIVTKVFNDMGFSFAYLLLLAACGIGFVRSLRK